MNIQKKKNHQGSFEQNSGTRKRILGTMLFTAVLIAGMAINAYAVTVYDPGVLYFSAQDQSMWGTGNGTSINKSKFLGAEWTNETTSLGGIVGSRTETTVNTNPGWWAWKACKETVNIFCGNEPSKWQQSLVTDTRTGAEVDLTSSGRVGIEAGVMVDSGTVDATADFSVSATLPDDFKVDAGTFFNLNAASTFDNGTIETQSPWAKAYVNGVLELSGSVSAQACLILVGCANGSTGLPFIDFNPEIISIDPNRIAILDGLVETKLAKETLSVQADLATKQVSVSTSSGIVIVDNIKTPGVLVDLAGITFELPDISSTGSKDGDKITSSGRDTVIDAKLDLDGIATMLGAPPLGATVQVLDTKIAGQDVTLEASFDLIDVDAGPTVDIYQDFELTPTLMVDLDFDKAVNIAGVGQVTSYTGAWDSLPDMALLESTTITPTFWVKAILENMTGVDFGFELDLAALKAGVTAKIGNTELLTGTLGPVFSETIPSGRFGALDLYNNPFDFTGFNSIVGSPITLAVNGDNTVIPGIAVPPGGPGTDPVPEPGTIFLMASGLAILGIVRMRKRGHHAKES